MARYYIIAGESSGDMHAANLIKSLKKKDPSASFRVWGGDKMALAGADVVKHIRELSFMGFWEVVANLRIIIRNLRFCKKDLLETRPDVLILIDYPGFNLRMAAFAHHHDIPVVYYISPQVWAWKQSRVKTIKRVVDKLLVILPFEKDFYARFDIDAAFPGHPLLDEVLPLMDKGAYADFREKNGLSGSPVVALLPGSRKQEISRMLHEMTAIAAKFPDYQFVVAGISGIDPKLYTGFMTGNNVSIVYDQTYPLLANATAAMVASGTATLETAIFGVPQVVCYKANPISYHIARKLVKINYISLVNLIMDKPVLTELIQHDFNRKTLKTEMEHLLYDPAYRSRMLSDYKDLLAILGGQGASDYAAGTIYRFIVEGN